MTDPKDPDADGHIEELLSQLQGIFGKLSQSEEESEEKLEPPAREAPGAPAYVPPLAPIMEPSPEGAPPLPDRHPSHTAPLAERTESPLLPPDAPIEAPVFTPSRDHALSSEPLGEPAVETSPVDESLVSTVVYHPSGREAETKILAQKLETMAPKFTKVAFQLRVMTTVPYDARSDPREAILSQVFHPGVRAVFCVIERPLDETRKKVVVKQLEAAGIYFQEVPLLSISKKAFYTDLLLGLVFFFDSLKSDSSGGSASEEHS